MAQYRGPETRESSREGSGLVGGESTDGGVDVHESGVSRISAFVDVRAEVKRRDFTTSSLPKPSRCEGTAHLQLAGR